MGANEEPEICVESCRKLPECRVVDSIFEKYMSHLLKYVGNGRQAVIVGTVKALIWANNEMMGVRDIAKVIQKNQFSKLGGQTPDRTVCAALSVYLRNGEEKSSEKKLFAKHKTGKRTGACVFWYLNDHNKNVVNAFAELRKFTGATQPSRKVRPTGISGSKHVSSDVDDDSDDSQSKDSKPIRRKKIETISNESNASPDGSSGISKLRLKRKSDSLSASNETENLEEPSPPPNDEDTRDLRPRKKIINYAEKNTKPQSTQRNEPISRTGSLVVKNNNNQKRKAEKPKKNDSNRVKKIKGNRKPTKQRERKEAVRLSSRTKPSTKNNKSSLPVNSRGKKSEKSKSRASKDSVPPKNSSDRTKRTGTTICDVPEIEDAREKYSRVPESTNHDECWTSADSKTDSASNPSPDSTAESNDQTYDKSITNNRAQTRVEDSSHYSSEDEPDDAAMEIDGETANPSRNEPPTTIQHCVWNVANSFVLPKGTDIAYYHGSNISEISWFINRH